MTRLKQDNHAFNPVFNPYYRIERFSEDHMSKTARKQHKNTPKQRNSIITMERKMASILMIILASVNTGMRRGKKSKQKSHATKQQRKRLEMKQTY